MTERPETTEPAEQLFGLINQLFTTMSNAQAERLHAMGDRQQREDEGLETEERDWYRISKAATWWNAAFVQLVCDGLGMAQVKAIHERTAASWTVLASILKYSYALGVQRGMRVQAGQDKRVRAANEIAYRELQEAKDEKDDGRAGDVPG